jgi:hypothetical protein
MRRRGTLRGFATYVPGYDEASESDTLPHPPAVPEFAPEFSPSVAYFAPQADSFPGDFETFVPPPAPPMPSRVSIWAAGGALIAVVAICATVTGLLAPVGAAIGVVATLASLIGLRTTGHLAGHGLAIVGVLLGLAAIVIGAFAVTRHYAWPNSTVDEIARWHSWLVARWPWLSH